MTVNPEDYAETTATTPIRPFEWLTSAESLLQTILLRLIDDDNNNKDSGSRVLHVGCGSSLVGEILAKHEKISYVLNVDKDEDVLNRMERHWKDQQHVLAMHIINKMEFQKIDFLLPTYNHDDEPIRRKSTDNNDDLPHQLFDLIIDKSTLDCLLCTDKAAAGMLCYIYRHLKPGCGQYAVVSFHSHELLLPLLRDLPGATWQSVTCTRMRRHNEDLVLLQKKDGSFANGSCNETATDKDNADNVTPNVATSTPVTSTDAIIDDEREEMPTKGCAAASGTTSLESDDDDDDNEYRKYVNVLICQKASSNNENESPDELDWDAVYQHIHKTNDQWFQKSHPLLTNTRKEQIVSSFADQHADNEKSSLPLKDCYPILFTSAEREHLEYDDFLEDWNAFLLLQERENTNASSSTLLPTDRMTAEKALAFLNAMQ